MLVFKLLSCPELKVKFDYSEQDSAPKQPGCYVITTFDGTILYIGQTNNICNRMEQHLDKKEKTKRTPSGMPYWFYYKLCDVSDLTSSENAWINEYKLNSNGKRPHFNKR